MSRSLCQRCERPSKTCLCDYLICCASDHQLVILQDPKEARHAMSSAPLLAKSIAGAQLLVGDVFDPLEVLGENWLTDTLLVYPGASPLSADAIGSARFRYLLLLDGTWRKVRRLMHLNPWLSHLPCMHLQMSEQSRYRIRKSPRQDGLSTIEAGVAALNVLHAEQNFDRVLLAFQAMIDMQLAEMGPAARQNHPDLRGS